MTPAESPASPGPERALLLADGTLERLSPLTLAFGPALEPTLFADFVAPFQTHFRFVLALGILLHAGYGLNDHVIVPELAPTRLASGS